MHITPDKFFLHTWLAEDSLPSCIVKTCIVYTGTLSGHGCQRYIASLDALLLHIAASMKMCGRSWAKHFVTARCSTILAQQGL